jgi:hypothetical protein
VQRAGFKRWWAEVCLGKVGAVAAREVSRFAAHWCMSLDDARRKCEACRRDYNHASQHPSVDVIEEKRLC